MTFKSAEEVRGWLRSQGFGPKNGTAWVRGDEYAAIERLPSGDWRPVISRMEDK